MRVTVGSATDIGRARRRNEDSYLVKAPLFVVADGMGGHRGGDVASKMAVDIIEPAASEVGSHGLPPLIERMKQANREVMDRGEADRDLRGMGTTVTAVIADGDRAHVAHIGDSRAYLLRGGTLQQLTEDHTLVQKMVREGRLTEEEAANHPQRSILLRVLGVEDDMPVDELTLDLHPGDRLLLCTDGLTNMLERDQVAEILRTEPDPQKAAEELIEAANRAGGDDNITVIVLDVAEGEPDTSPDGQGRAQSSTQSREGFRSAGESMVGSLSDLFQRGRPEGASGEETSGEGSSKAAATGTMTMARPTPASEVAEPPKGRTIRWGRVGIWGGTVVVLVVAALIGSRVYLDRQWYVGDAGGRVAIYQGIPATVLGYDLHHVVETSQVSSVQAEQLRIYQDLSSGITASSFADAQNIVNQICLDVANETGGGTGTAVPTTPTCPAPPTGTGG
jgi:protein phosphatase